MGPVSLEKLKELLENKSLKPEDEVCSGNGYWFYVKEKELLERYVYSGVKQSFNPVSEADSVVAKSGQADASYPKMPCGEDMLYPNESNVNDTKVTLNLDEFEKKKN